jgi:hypothetical protein
MAAMGSKSREVIAARSWARRSALGGAHEAAQKAAREADRAEAYAGRFKEGYGGPAQPSPTIAQYLNGGYGWLEIKCHRCKTRARAYRSTRSGVRATRRSGDLKQR